MEIRGNRFEGEQGVMIELGGCRAEIRDCEVTVFPPTRRELEGRHGAAARRAIGEITVEEAATAIREYEEEWGRAKN